MASKATPVLAALWTAALLFACGDDETHTAIDADMAQDADATAPDAGADVGDLIDTASPDVADTEEDSGPGSDALADASEDADDTAEAAEDTAPDAGPDTGADLLQGLTLTESPQNMLALFAEWRTPEPASSSLSWSCQSGDFGEVASESQTTVHLVFAMGFLENDDCTVTASSTFGDGRTGLATAPWMTGDLPDDAFPAATITTREPWRIQPGWTLFNLVNHFDAQVLRFVLVDQLGRYRWYYRAPWSTSGSDNDVRTVPEGILVGTSGRTNRPEVVRWDGSVAWEGPLAMSHHVQLWPDESHAFFLESYFAMDCPGVENADGPATLVDRDTNEVVWRWQICQHYTPPEDVLDWVHGNTLEPFPDGSAFLYSSRNQNALFKVDVETGDIDWILGFAGRPIDGFNGDFELTEEDRFYHQHSPELQPDGHILLYDNGFDGIRPESRAIEIAYDEEDMTAEVVWEFRHDPPLYSDIWGDADQLPNGNRLITFGFRSTVQGSVLDEVDPANNTVLWDCELPPKWGVYRAERVADPPRGYVMENE